MKLFCAYAFTGEDLEILTKRMRLVVDTLNASGHEAYCNRFDEVVSKLQAQDDNFKKRLRILNRVRGWLQSSLLLVVALAKLWKSELR